MNMENNKEMEDCSMEAVIDRSGYKRLNLDSLRFSDKVMSSKEALKDVTPIEWSDEVISGERKVIIKKQ